MIETIARPWRGGVPLNPRTALSDLIAKVFSAPFAKTFSAPMGGAAAAAAIPWYLSGGIAAANCKGAYDAKNAASYAASLTNLANAALPLTEGTAPAWSAGTGWTGDAATHNRFLKTGIVPTTDQTYSLAIQYSSITNNDCFLGGCGVWVTNHFEQISIMPTLSSATYVRYSNGYHTNGIATSGGKTSGNLIVAGNKGYRDGVLETGTAAAWTIPSTTLEIYLLAVNYTIIYAPIAGNIIAAAIYNINISAYATALATAMAAL